MFHNKNIDWKGDVKNNREGLVASPLALHDSRKGACERAKELCQVESDATATEGLEDPQTYVDARDLWSCCPYQQDDEGHPSKDIILQSDHGPIW